MSIALGIIGAVGVLTVFSVLVAVDDAGVGYALVTAFVIYVSVVPSESPATALQCKSCSFDPEGRCGRGRAQHDQGGADALRPEPL